MTVGSIVAKLQLDLTSYREGLDRANSLLEQYHAQASQAAATLAGFGAAAAAGLGGALRWSAQFEQELRNVNSILHETEPGIQALGESVRGLAGRTGQSPATLARGLYDIASSGFAGAEGLQVLEAAARAATAGLSTTATASKAITAVLNAYGLKATEAGRVSDLLFKIVERGVITFEELAGNVGDVVAAAATANLKFEEVGAAISAMTKAGIQPTEAFTSLNMVLRSLVAPSAEAKKAAQGLGIEWDASALAAKGLRGIFAQLGVALKTSVQDIDALTKAGASQPQILEAVARNAGMTTEKLSALFPEVRALRGALVLSAQGGQVFSQELGAMAQATGSTQRAFAEQSKAFAMQWQQAWASVQAAAIGVSQLVLPVLGRLAGALRASAEGLTALQKQAPAVTALGLAVAVLGTGLLSLSASYALYKTHLAEVLVLSRQLLGAMLQSGRGLATARVTFAALGSSAGTAAAALKALWATVTGPALWRAGVWTGAVVGLVALATAAVQADTELARLDDELLKLIDRAGKVRAALPVQELQALRPSWIQMVSTKLGEMFGLRATEGVRLYREQVTLAAGEVERAEQRASQAKQVRAETDRQLQSAEQQALASRIAAIEQERDTRVKAGGDAAKEEQRAQLLITQARAEHHHAELSAQAELLAAQGKAHAAALVRIQAEAEEKRKSWTEELGQEKAREQAALWAHAKRIELARTEAKERTRVLEQAGSEILTRWQSLAEAMYSQGRVKTGEYVSQMKAMLGLIDQINAARRAAGEGELLGQQRLAILVKLRQQELDSVEKLRDVEAKLAQDRLSWAQEELRQRQQVGDYELQMTELAFQHRRDLQTLTNHEDQWAFSRISQDELALLQQKRQQEDLDAETRLQYLEREKQLILELSQSGAMPASQAKEALDQAFGAATEARQELQSREQEVWAQRKAEHEQTLAEIVTQQKTLREQLQATTAAFGTSITDTLKRVESGLLAALRSIQVQGAKTAAVGPGHGGNQYVFYVQGRPVTANLDASELAEQLATMLETQYAYRRQ